MQATWKAPHRLVPEDALGLRPINVSSQSMVAILAKSGTRLMWTTTSAWNPAYFLITVISHPTNACYLSLNRYFRHQKQYCNELTAQVVHVFLPFLLLFYWPPLCQVRFLHSQQSLDSPQLNFPTMLYSYAVVYCQLFIQPLPTLLLHRRYTIKST